jgi:UTP--glucose-1-phosphate uridylyltransferase
MAIQRIRKAVFPVGGLGTRFLPATKSVPKEMLPVVDRPLIQYVVDEAIEAGIEQLILVTGRGKQAIEDYFDLAYELETTMAARGKALDVLHTTRLSPGRVTYVRQQEPLGLGHAVWCAREVVGNEPFAVLLADDFMVGNPGCLRQMVEAYERVGGNLVCAQSVDAEDVEKYGVITPGSQSGALTEIKGLIEKPKRGTAPSNLAVIGRYILQPDIMEILARQERGAGGEIQLTDAMSQLIAVQAFHGVTFAGERYDCGDKAGFIKANIAVALAREDIGQPVQEYLRQLGLPDRREPPLHAVG